MQGGPGLLLLISADGRGCRGEGKGGPAAPRGVGRHPFPGWDGPGSGRVESCGRGKWVGVSGGDGFSAAGLAPLVFFAELAGPEHSMLGITALMVE